VREFLPADESFQLPPQSVLPSSRSLLGTTALLPQAIHLAPIVLTASGVTIIIGVGVIVLAAVIAGNMSEECLQQWEDARDECRRFVSSRDPQRGLTGGYKDIENCARGHVEERCGGNRIDWGKQGRPGRRY